LESIAIGNNVEATTRSVIIGSNAASTGFEGCMAMGTGDSPSALLLNTNSYQMAMKFSGGYKFFSDAACTVGAEIAPGGNSWTVISDKRKKEKIVPVQGNTILGKISNMTLTTWNYIGQSAETFRHYGPMAQDFYAAFGKDEMGTIGNDTTINQADMAGVTFSAVQALVCHTQDLAAKNELLRLKIAALEKNKKAHIAENEQLKAELTKRKSDIENRLEILEINTRKNYSATR
jgi:chaperonin cofactor prefoldin